MIVILVKRLTVEGNEFSGEETPGLLELEENALFSCEEPVWYEFRASLVDGGVLVEGRLGTVLTAVCDRCLAPLSLPLTNKFCHYYEEVDDDELDITADLREDLVINIPYRFLCSENCAGLCQECGGKIRDGVCDCKPEKKSRSGKGRGNTEKSPNIWAALDQLKG